MKSMGRFLEYLKAGVLPYLAAESIWVIIASFVRLFMQAVPSVQEDAYLGSIIVVLLWGMIFTVWYLFEIRGEARENNGSVKLLLSVGTMIHMIFLGVGCQFFISGMLGLLANQFRRLFESYGNVMDSILNGRMLFVILYTVVVAPLAEEIVFRGVILHKAGRNVPFWGANILQATFFGLYHDNVVQGIYAILVGLLLGLTYRRFQSIIAPILLHMIINIAAYIVIGLSTSTLRNSVMVIAGAVFVLLAVNSLGLVERNIMSE
jgi:membrane protease YdiL (CAAX protease family)